LNGRVLVLGSINLDLVVVAPRLPAPGETVLGGEFQRHPGGKGANQAVAAVRAGGTVHMLGAIGRDAEGEAGLDALSREGVDVSAVARSERPSGVALIAVGPDGQNQIVVAPGANATLSPETVSRTLQELRPGPADVLLASLEVPMGAVVAAAALAATSGATVIVNPAPAAPLPSGLLATRPILTPNRTELQQLAEAAVPDDAARRLIALGARAVVVTLGEEGCAVHEPDAFAGVPGVVISDVADTTGAGDTFSGVLATWLAAGESFAQAARAANAAAALSVRVAGARGAPREDEIRAMLSRA
jgi:ribokinase